MVASRAVRRDDGRYDVEWTPVQTVQGAKGQDTVMLDTTQTFSRWHGLTASSTRVKQARTSNCWAAPHVVQIKR